MKKLLPTIALFSVFYLLFSVAAVAPVVAQEIPTTNGILDIWKGTGTGSETCNISIKGCDMCDGLIVINNIINILFKLSIPITVGVIVYGAIQMMVAGASISSVEDARKTITTAVIGLVVTLCSWIIISEVLHLVAGTGPVVPWQTITCIR